MAQRRRWVAFGPEVMELDVVLCLAGRMGISRVEAAGYVALAVAYGIARGEDDGVIWHLTDKAIEDACYWDGPRGELVQGLTDSYVFVGDREDDNNKLRIEPGLWQMLAGKAIQGRERKRKS